MREFINDKMGRSTLTRLLKRQGVNNLKALYREQSGESEEPKPKTFKDYDLGLSAYRYQVPAKNA